MDAKIEEWRTSRKALVIRHHPNDGSKALDLLASLKIYQYLYIVKDMALFLDIVLVQKYSPFEVLILVNARSDEMSGKKLTFLLDESARARLGASGPDPVSDPDTVFFIPPRLIVTTSDVVPDELAEKSVIIDL
jgi:hypothetical protein